MQAPFFLCRFSVSLRSVVLSVVLCLSALSGSELPAPGRATPVAAAQPEIIKVLWGDGYYSFIAVDRGEDIRRPAVVVTLMLKETVYRLPCGNGFCVLLWRGSYRFARDAD